MFLLSDDETGVVLVDVELPVEAEVFGVRAQEALDVGLSREDVELPPLPGRADTCLESSFPVPISGSRGSGADAPRGGCYRSRTRRQPHTRHLGAALKVRLHTM